MSKTNKQGITPGEYSRWGRSFTEDEIIISRELIYLKCKRTDEAEEQTRALVPAINACIAINPTHPEYVAEKIGEMRDLCLSYLGTLTVIKEKYSWANEIADKVRQVLADIERGK